MTTKATDHRDCDLDATCQDDESVEPPARVWTPPKDDAGNPITPPLRIWTVGGGFGHFFENPGHFAMYEYAHLAPIREAVRRCRVIDAGSASQETAQVVIRKSDWDALVASVRGESANGK